MSQELTDIANRLIREGRIDEAKAIAARARVGPRHATQERIAAAKAGTLSVPPQSAARHQLADDVAAANMGLPSTPTGEATSILENVPSAGFQAVRSKSVPVVGAWSDEMAGAASWLFGNGFDQGRERFNELARQYQEQNPENASRAKTLGAVEGTIAAVGAPAAAPAAVSRGLAANVGRGVLTGGGAGAVDATVSAAGAAEPGERVEAAKDAFLPGAVLGAVAGGTINLAIHGLSRAAKKVLSRSVEKPTVPNLRQAKTLAYRDVDQSGYVFPKTAYDDVLARAKAAMDDPRGAYVKGDTQTEQAFALLERNRDEMTLGQVDEVRKRLWKRYAAADAAQQDTILDMIGAIDDMIDANAGANDLVRMARDANSRFRKAELIESAFDKAYRQTEASGSGGNLFNKYKQAVNNILDNPRKVKWFSPEEVEMMRAFVETETSTQILRRIGKMAPSGNGLMQTLNVGAWLIDPSTMAISGMAQGAKVAADSRVARQADDLFTFTATGSVPNRGTVVPGAAAGAAGLNVNPDDF